MNKTKLLTILRNNKCIDILAEHTETVCGIIKTLLTDDFNSHYQNIVSLVETSDFAELKNKLYDYAAHNKSEKLSKARKTEKLARSEAAECEYVAMTCDNIVKLLTEQEGYYSSEELDEFMHNYVTDIAKIDKDLAKAIEIAHDDKQFKYVCYLCEYQANTLHSLAELVLRSK